jgi:hypothetical protein
MSQFKNYFFLRHQPLKTIYLVYVALSLILLRLPCWFLISLLPSLRPRRSWTIGRTLLIKGMQVIVPAIFNIGAFRYVRVDPHKFTQKENEVGLVWIDAAPDLIVGEVAAFAKENEVSCVQVPAYWFGARNDLTHTVGQQSSEKVILALHGTLLVL